jgi:ADP-ribosylation factor related protein 1
VIWNKYYSESHGIVFVIDSANEARFQEAKDTLRTFSINMGVITMC